MSVNQELPYDSVSIKSVFDGYLVKTIERNAFKDSTVPSKIVIEEGVEILEEGCFENCTGITEIVLPRSIKLLQSNVFKGCENVTIKTYENSIPSSWSTDFNPDNRPVEFNYLPPFVPTSNIQYEVVEGENRARVIDTSQTQFKDVFIAAEYEGYPVTEIAANVFENHTLDSLNLPLSVTTIGDNAFKGSSVTKVLGGKVNYIGTSAFENCSLLTEVNMDSSSLIGGIKTRAFATCSELTTIVLTKELQTLELNSFLSCNKLITVRTDYVKEAYPETWVTTGNDNLFNHSNWIPFNKTILLSWGTPYPTTSAFPDTTLEIEVPETREYTIAIETQGGGGGSGGCFLVYDERGRNYYGTGSSASERGSAGGTGTHASEPNNAVYPGKLAGYGPGFGAFSWDPSGGLGEVNVGASRPSGVGFTIGDLFSIPGGIGGAGGYVKNQGAPYNSYNPYPIYYSYLYIESGPYWAINLNTSAASIDFAGSKGGNGNNLFSNFTLPKGVLNINASVLVADLTESISVTEGGEGGNGGAGLVRGSSGSAYSGSGAYSPSRTKIAIYY